MNENINDALGITQSTGTNNSSNIVLSKKYPALRTLSGVLALIAWLIAIITLIVVIGLFSESSREQGSWVYPVAALAVGAISFLSLLAYSEIINVFIDIEENTRKSALHSDNKQ